MSDKCVWLDPAVDLNKLYATIEREGYKLFSKRELSLDHYGTDHGTIRKWKAADRSDAEVQVGQAWGPRDLVVVSVNFICRDETLHRLIRQSFDGQPTRASAKMLIEGQRLARAADEKRKARLAEIRRLYPHIRNLDEIVDADPECDAAYEAFESWRRSNCEAVFTLTQTLGGIGAFRIWFR